VEYVSLQLLNGVVTGLIYALAATGLTLIFAVLKIVNFAHGALYMLGAYAAYYAVTLLGVPPLISVVVAAAALFLAGVLFERLFLTPLQTGKIERKDEYSLIITFALMLFLENLAIVTFGPFSKRPPSFFRGAFHWDFLTITYDRMIAAAAAIILLVLLVLFLRRTSWGQALDAVSQNRSAAAIVGINPRRFFTLAFGVGAALAGAAGGLIGPIFSVSPTMGLLPAIKAFVIVVLGGMGSVVGSIIGGLFIGVGEALWVALIPDATRALAYSNAFGVFILAVVLLVRPTGLFGRRYLQLD
jgi:branched-chain amino acid transport system permease protein